MHNFQGFKSKLINLIYSGVFAVAQFLIPFCLILSIYSKISLKLINTPEPATLRPGQKRKLDR